MDPQRRPAWQPFFNAECAVAAHSRPTLDVMTNDQWRRFFLAGRDILGRGANYSRLSESWCGWTTFRSLESGDLHYWTCGLPDYSDVLESQIKDGGLWGQPFYYDDIAHLIVPRRFYWETDGGPNFENGTKPQDIEALSRRLTSEGVEHRLTELVLEIKLY